MPTFDVNEVYRPLLAYPRWVIALSGGLDSTVLLSTVKSYLSSLPATKKQPELLAIHIDHQLSPNHEQWVEHCKLFCSKLNVTLLIETVIVDKSSGDGIEQAARKVRYEAFAKHLNKDSVLLMGHHANDQAETVLMRLFRGSGVQGASGIPKQRYFANASIVRPLLNISSLELAEYALNHQLKYIDDESNADDVFDRNYLRMHLLPLITARWPQVIKTLSRFANNAKKSEALNNDLGDIDFKNALSKNQQYGENLNIKQITLLADYRRHNLYRYWLKKYSQYLPTSVQINQIDDLIMKGRGDSRCIVGNMSFRIHQNGVYRVDETWLERLHTTAIRQQWSPVAPLKLAGLGVLSANQVKSQIGLKDDTYCIGFRSFDSIPDGCQVNGQTKSLNKLMQEKSIPAWLRDVYPIIYCQKGVAAVGDIIICDDFSTLGGWKLNWQYQ